MAVDAATLRDSLRQVPSLPALELSTRARAALTRAVVLAAVPAAARRAVTDRALVAFAGREPSDAGRGRGPAIGMRARAWAMAPSGEDATVAPPDRTGSALDWGVRSRPAPLPRAAPIQAPAAGAAPPYGGATAGALAGVAAAGRLMRRHHLGDPGDRAALERLGATVDAFDRATMDTPPQDPDAYDRLLGWAGMVRQAAFLHTRLGVDPHDPSVLAEALDDRGRWLAERPPWPHREAAAANLIAWLPLVDCAEAFDLPAQGPGALRALGESVRRAAGTPLPALRDPMRTARLLAALDAAAVLREALGVDPNDPAATTRLHALSRAVEHLPEAPASDVSGAVDHSCLERVRRLDRAQASELGLDGLGGEAIPLVASGLPVLAALAAASRAGFERPVRAPWRADAPRSIPSS